MHLFKHSDIMKPVIFYNLNTSDSMIMNDWFTKHLELPVTLETTKRVRQNYDKKGLKLSKGLKGVGEDSIRSSEEIDNYSGAGSYHDWIQNKFLILSNIIKL